MNETQYLRQWKLLIDGQDYITSNDEYNFRIVFDIDVQVNNAVGKADIRIYNLVENTGIKQGATVQLKAGYKDKCDSIFTGVVSNTYKERDGAEINTRLLCRSGVAVSNIGTTCVSFPAGVRIVEILRSLAAQWPVALDVNEEQFKDDEPFSSGYIIDGDIPATLDSLARQFKFAWTENLGTLYIDKEDKPRDTAIFQIDMLNGMVGIPEVTRGPNGMGVYVTTRINPYIRVNSRVNVKSRFSTYNTGNQLWVPNKENLEADGEYNVFRLKYEGDTHGDAWNMSIDGMRVGTKEPDAVSTTSANAGPYGPLIWGAKVSPEFRKAVREMASRQKLDPNWYMAIMAFETGMEFKASTPNRAGGSARGLIQFMPSVAVELGTTSAQLVMMTEVEQMKYVEKYFQRNLSKIRSIADMYMAVLWPAATSASMDYVLWTKDGAYSRQYYANKGLDKNGDGKITKAEAAESIYKMQTIGIKYSQ